MQISIFIHFKLISLIFTLDHHSCHVMSFVTMSSSLWLLTIEIFMFESKVYAWVMSQCWTSTLALSLTIGKYIYLKFRTLNIYIFRIFNRYILCEVTANLLRQFSCQLETILFSKTNVKLSTGNVRYILVMQNEALFYYQHNSPPSFYKQFI